MAIGKRKRFQVLKRDGFRCRYCGAEPGSGLLHVDHVEPRSRGGSDSMENLVTACRDCNLGKADMLIRAPANMAECLFACLDLPAGPSPVLRRFMDRLLEFSGPLSVVCAIARFSRIDVEREHDGPIHEFPAFCERRFLDAFFESSYEEDPSWPGRPETVAGYRLWYMRTLFKLERGAA